MLLTRRLAPLALILLVPVALASAPLHADDAQPDSGWHGRALAEDLIQRNDLAAEYERFMAGYTRIVDYCINATDDSLGGARVLSIVERVQDTPLSIVDEALGATDPVEAAGAQDDVAAMLTALAPTADIDVGTFEPPPPPSESTLDAWLDLIVDVVNRIKALRDAAFADLSLEERRALTNGALALAATLRQTIYIEYSSAIDLLKQTVKLSSKVRLDKLVEAGRLAAWLVSHDNLKALRDVTNRVENNAELELDGVTGGVVATRVSDAGLIIVGSQNTNTYTSRAAVIIDPRGNDTYVDEPGRALWTSADDDPAPSLVSIVIDLDGNDTYKVSDKDNAEVSQGAAVMGVGVIADHNGNDKYEGARLAHGAAIYGVGILADYDGNDTYTAIDFSQGVGAFGIGLLYDGDGRDTYSAGVYSQALGSTLGVGCLYDRKGNDDYRCTDLVPSTYGTDGEYHGMCMGCGVGLRGVPRQGGKNWGGGGVGLMIDGAGDDTYAAGEFGLGIGYYFGFGIVKTGAGNDAYNSSRYGLATGAHQGLGIVIDMKGDDKYHGRSVANQAGNWDAVVSVLWDAKGNDEYTLASGLGLGAATITSLAYLLDSDGDDKYEARGGNTIGDGGHDSDAVRNSVSFGLFIDERGDDEYKRGGNGPERADDTSNVHRKEKDDNALGYGLFEDR